MYRFRSVESLIGKYQELEKQQIYFASVDELNDPLEGTRQYFWKGDRIIWMNFFKHYLLCLEHGVFLTRLLKEDQVISQKDIPIYKSIASLPTEIYKERIGKIYELFFSDKFVQSYLELIINNPYKIYKDELHVHLRILSNRAIKCISEIDVKSGLIPPNEEVEINKVEENINININFENMWLYSDETQYSELIHAINDTLKQLDTQLLFKYRDSPKLQSVYIEFPQLYLNAVTELTYPKAYVACFMDNCSNSSIWGTYGNNHTGVCLKFKTSTNNPMLSLKPCSTNLALLNNNYLDNPFYKIEYTSNFSEMDFFCNLGRLTLSQIIEQWYTDEKGNYSICSEELLNHEDDWREQYWNAFQQAYLKKTPDWSHEREFRLIVSSVLDSFNDREHRIFEYKFEDLDSIIFGIKTSKTARAEIIDVIYRKCKKYGRKNFEFYEMTYSLNDNRLIQRKMYTININE